MKTRTCPFRLRTVIASIICGGLIAATIAPVTAADSLTWDATQQRFTAQVESWPLAKLLKEMAGKTGWKIYLEPGTTHLTSAAFENRPLGEGLGSLLGNLNFALVPQSNAPAKLFVFRTSMHDATQLVAGDPDADASGAKSTRIKNELIVRLKPGAKIEDLARLLGAKVTGRIDELNLYRLEFGDEAAADSARTSLVGNSDVAAVDYNYSVERPENALPLLASSASGLNLSLKPPSANGRIVIGLVDTGVQSLGGDLDSFMLKSLKMAGESQLSADGPMHGTSMAETILAALQVVTKGQTSVQLLPVDVYGNYSTSSTFDVARGIVAAVNAGANPINLSLGGTQESRTLQDVIAAAAKKGIVFFGAAGNEPVTTPYYPAAYPDVIAVTAGDRRGNVASYANRGDFVDMMAPGTSIVQFNGRSYYVSGTSAATAFSSGMAAGMAETLGQSIGQASSTLRTANAFTPPRKP